jgi:hypothetical protein
MKVKRQCPKERYGDWRMIGNDKGNHVLPTAGQEVGVLCSARKEERLWSVQPYRRRERGVCSHRGRERGMCLCSHIKGEKPCRGRESVVSTAM